MMSKKPEFTYKQLNHVAKMAHACDANIMGLSAFTSVMGDAGVSVSQQAPDSICHYHRQLTHCRDYD